MVQAAISVVLLKPYPAENTLDHVEINGSSTCRTEKGFWHHTANVLANVYVILVPSDTFVADTDFKVGINQE